MVIGISRNLSNRLDANPIQLSEETYQEGIGILETTGIHKLDTLRLAIIVDAVIVYTLAYACQQALPIILNHLLVNKTAAMTPFIKIIITEMDFETILAKSLYLIANFLADAADLGKTMINEEQYFHNQV